MMTNQDRATCLFDSVYGRLVWKVKSVLDSEGEKTGVLIEAKDPVRQWRWCLYVSPSDGEFSIWGDENAHRKWNDSGFLDDFLSGKKMDIAYFMEKVFGRRKKVQTVDTADRIADYVHREYGISKAKAFWCASDSLLNGAKGVAEISAAVSAGLGLRVEPYEIELVRDWTVIQYFTAMVLMSAPGVLSEMERDAAKSREVISGKEGVLWL